jgi:ribosomal protein S12 methylthiotransferase accessory factor
LTRQVVRLSSSLRACEPGATLARAKRLAPRLGISRVTDITRLDRVGLPVFASIRPTAQRGSLCVNAGKGLSADEARVGAYMEAIEFAFAEYNRAGLAVRRVKARDVYEGASRPDSILDFCPLIDAEIPLDETLPCVEAEDVRTREKLFVPAELIFLPFPAELRGAKYFGSGSSGLCSGNSVLEATVHGIAEVIERDVISFLSVDDRSALVEPGSLPPLEGVREKLSAAGLELHVRHAPNVFRIPFFMAHVCEPEATNPIFINGGFGCHPSRQIALARAVCEAAQSRLSFIHGGRDDLVERYRRFDGFTWPERAAHAASLRARVSRGDPSIRFDEVHDYDEGARSLEAALELLLALLARNGFARVLRVAYTKPRASLQVLRVIIPRLEHFNETTPRLGPRLRDHVRDGL